ncbi:MAG: hypothetical protein ACP5KE_07495 [Candidatus Methanodesulfokora sp.]|jgi:hypothetical protein|nr:MAG: hypothetical protein C0200_04485 [Candidatus Korarchaeota archaeon]
MPVRLKLRIRLDKEVDVIALLNSGYEAPTPQLLIPVDVARALGLWPPEEAVEVTLDTAGGPLRAWYCKRRAKVKVIAEDAESKEVDADMIISPIADEALISDVLADELEIAVESFGRGLWRFRWERDKLRKSEVRMG